MTTDQGQYTLFQTPTMFNTKNEPYGKLGLWMIKTFQCRLISVNKCAVPLEDVDNVSVNVTHVWGQGTPVHPFQFCCVCKTTFKTEVLKN